MFLTGTILNVATVLIGMIIGVLAPLFLRGPMPSVRHLHDSPITRWIRR
jgi:hypothetical protein